MLAVRGVVDFGQARPLERAWRQKLNMLKLALDWEISEKTTKATYDLQLALLGNGGLEEQSFRSGLRRADELFYDYLGTLKPWEGRSFMHRKMLELRSLVPQWAAAFGDPNDPDVRAEIERTAYNMRRVAEENRNTDSDEYRLAVEWQSRKRKG